ncbi:MAG: type II toxin-antitoxin system VapC family toxin [Anaerolineae bacterium]|nr:type II toxin-antitoxin system VapC family toxin [Anaerolineae bacterium]
MRYLLDTHIFKWLDNESSKISSKAHALMADRNNQLVLSLVSVWEIQIKVHLGKMNLRTQLKTVVEDQQRINQIELLPLKIEHILFLDNLAPHHRDPFDRILIAQAISEGLTLITHDSTLSQYPVKTEW